MIDLFQKAKNQLDIKLPFVLWSNPNEVVLNGIFPENDKLLEVKNFEESGFIISEFSGDRIYYFPLEDNNFFSTQKNILPSVSSDISYENDENSQSKFISLVELAQNEIENNSFGKVVLSRTEKISIDLDIFSTFGQLLSRYPTAFCSVWYHPKVGFWMGATPEQLLAVQDLELKTVALAGTQKQQNIEDVVWNQKEIDEQQYVSDFIKEELNKVSKEIVCTRPYTFQAGNIFHIKTDITAQLQDEDDLAKIIHLLHPTPAVCGYPKNISKDFILKNEGYDRGFYSGFLGEMNLKSNRLNLFVNLRCMQVLGKNVQFYVGCGITKESIPELEYIETVNKSMTMKNILIKNKKQ